MDKNYQIVLINPTNGPVPAKYYAPTEHLGLAYLTASLRENGFKVKIIDAYALNLSYDEVVEETITVTPDFIGITSEYNTIEIAIKLVKEFRKKLPKVHLSFGGQHSTFSSIEIFRDLPEIDSIMRGEGELTIVELASRLYQNKDLNGTEGVIYRRPDGEIVKNNDRAAIDNLDSLPFPAHDTIDECLKRGIRPAIGVLTSRGCYANCSFCNASKFFNLGGGRAWRAHSIKRVVDELEYLVEKYKDEQLYEVIYFNDENFVGPGAEGVERVVEIAREIIRRDLKISYEMFCRADSFNNNEEAVKVLSEAGLVSVLVGLESGYQKGLNNFSKGTTVNQNLTTIEMFKKYNVITSSSGFLMFNPYSTFKELEENAKFLLSIRMSTLYNMSLKVLGYPGIRMNKNMEQEGLLTSDFGYLNVSGYRFKDERISVLVKAFTFDDSFVRREDAANRYLDFAMANIERKLNIHDLPREQGEFIQKLWQKVEGARFMANLVSYNFFIKSITLAENGWEQNVFDDMRTKYTDEIDEALKEMNDTFASCLKHLDHILS